jgi:hypothetical protein
MASNVTLTIYLGSGKQGVSNEQIVNDASTKKKMSRSEFALYCIAEQIKREFKQEISLKA